jgi:hypothetical protein
MEMNSGDACHSSFVGRLHYSEWNAECNHIAIPSFVQRRGRDVELSLLLTHSMASISTEPA